MDIWDLWLIAAVSMKDQSGTRSFETQEAKIAALPCLDWIM
jgi:hypothetical protein